MSKQYLTPSIDVGNGPTIVCLHGFPQNASAFADMARELSEDGFRVVAPNQRGYTTDSTQLKRRDFRFAPLAEDVLDYLDSIDVQSAVFVGHDLGASVVWEIARQHPDRVRTVVSISAPHPAGFLHSLLTTRQLIQSWYFLPAQSRLIARWMFSPERRESAKRLQNYLHRSGMSVSEAERYVDFLRQRGIFESALRWYQAMPFNPVRGSFFCAKVDAVLVWGSQDPFTTRSSMIHSKSWVAGPFEYVELDGGHWLLDQNAAELAQIVSRAARKNDRD